MTKHVMDAELELRSLDDGAVTSTTDEDGVSLSNIRNEGDFKVVFAVKAMDDADGDETYRLTVETDSVVGFTDSPVEVGALTVTEPGTYEVPLSGAYIAAADADATALRVGVEIAGTSPSITYGAFIAS